MFSILFKIMYLHVHVIYMCIIISFGTAQKKKKKKKKKKKRALTKYGVFFYALLYTPLAV